MIETTSNIIVLIKSFKFLEEKLVQSVAKIVVNFTTDHLTHEYCAMRYISGFSFYHPIYDVSEFTLKFISHVIVVFFTALLTLTDKLKRGWNHLKIFKEEKREKKSNYSVTKYLLPVMIFRSVNFFSDIILLTLTKS